MGSELGTRVDLGQGSPADEDLRKRLTASKGPSTASSTSQWQNIDRIRSQFGRVGAFDHTNVPLNHLEQMRRDPMIAFGLMFIKVFLARAPWYIKSTDPQRAAFIDAALRRIYGRFVLQYTGCLDYGYQGMVKNFERAPLDGTYHDPNDVDGKPVPIWTASADPLLWTPFTALSPKRCSPSFSKAGAFNGIDLRPMSSSFPDNGSSKNPEIPLDWAMWATNEKDSVFGSLWGFPRTAYAYRFWTDYWYKFALAARAFEKWADPPVVCYHPTEIAIDEDGETRNMSQEGLALAEQLRSGSNVSLPSDVVVGLDAKVTNQRQWEIHQVETTVDFSSIRGEFEYLDVARLRALMVPEQAFLEGKGGTSSRNVASTLGDVFEEQQAVIKAEIDDHINRYMIPQLLEANFGAGGPSCEIVTTGFDAQDLETARTIVQAMAQNSPSRLASIDFRKLLERMGLPLLGPKAQAEQAKTLVEEAQKAPPKVLPKGGNAGVDKQGLYYKEDGEFIRLADAPEDKVGFVQRLTDFFKREHDATEPTDVDA
jgi:hypothetical protein